MKPKILLTLIFAVSMQFCFGQITFEKTFGGIDSEQGSSVQQTNDNGYIITGSTTSFGDSTRANVYLIKTDENGDTLWTKTFGDTLNDGATSVLQTNDTGYIIVASTGIFPDIKNTYIIKTDINGDTLWTKIFTSNYNVGVSVQQTNDNGYIITGYIKDNYFSKSDVYLVKINGNGDTLWTKTYGGTNDDDDYGQSVLQTNDNGFIIAGGTENYDAEMKKIYLIKTDINGDTLWTKTYGGASADVAFSITKANDNGYVICGITSSFGSGKDDIYIIKIDSDGNQQWYNTFGGIYRDVGYSIYKTNDNGYIIVGYTSYSTIGQYPNVYLIKTDINGDTLWTKTYGGTGADVGHSVQQTNDNGYIIAGTTSSFGNGGNDVYLIKTDENGNVITKVNEIVTSNLIRIYPNPSNGTFNINIQNSNKEDMSLKITNINGQFVYNKQFNKTGLILEKIDLSDCSKGMYFVKVQSKNIIKVKKIIIN